MLQLFVKRRLDLNLLLNQSSRPSLRSSRLTSEIADLVPEELQQELNAQAAQYPPKFVEAEAVA